MAGEGALIESGGRGQFAILNWVFRRGLIKKVTLESRFEVRRNEPCISLRAEQTRHRVSFRAGTCLLVCQRNSMDASSWTQESKGEMSQVSSERYHGGPHGPLQRHWLMLRVKWGATGEFQAKERHDQFEICFILKGHIWLQY